MRKKSKEVKRGHVLRAIRRKVGPLGHVRRQGHVVEAGLFGVEGFRPYTVPSFTWGALLKQVEQLGPHIQGGYK